MSLSVVFGQRGFGRVRHADPAVIKQTGGSAKLSGNGDKLLSIAFAKNVTFRIGTAELTDKSVAVVPYDDLEEHEGRRIPGVLGVDLFRRYVVVIDYAAKMLSLYEPHDFVYRGSGAVVPLSLDKAAVFKAAVSIEGRDPVPANLAVDLGTYSALRLYTPFVAKRH